MLIKGARRRIRNSTQSLAACLFLSELSLVPESRTDAVSAAPQGRAREQMVWLCRKEILGSGERWGGNLANDVLELPVEKRSCFVGYDIKSCTTGIYLLVTDFARLGHEKRATKWDASPNKQTYRHRTTAHTKLRASDLALDGSQNYKIYCKYCSQQTCDGDIIADLPSSQ